MIVDDETPIREWIVYCIEKLGENFQIIGTAKSGKEAYEIILEHKPNVVITDIKMPGMDGIELMQLVKKVLPYTVFVILTNYAEFSYAKEAITYGAMEYLLKSELRSKDLADILEKILKERTELFKGKNSEILSNGYVDLYSLYQNYKDETYVTHYWEDLGMNTDKPYCIIGIFEDTTFNQKQTLFRIAKEVSPSYFNVAFGQQVIYIIIQEETKQILEQNVKKFSDNYFQITMQDLAVGDVQDSLNSFMKAIEQVQSVLSGTFFTAQKGIFYYSHILQVKQLDRNVVRRGFHEILSLMSLKLYEKTIDAIITWFDNLIDLNVQDIVWAKEMCIKLVISLEERFYQFNSEYEYSGIKTCDLSSAEICKKVCLGIIKTMLPGNSGARSQSINEALDFIHRNYNQHISLIEVANHVYRSPEYFSRLFKEKVGVNFSVYLMMYRLNCAEQMLKTSNLQISQIACDVGYTNPGYFSRIFKKYMGTTPEEARGQNSARRSK
jgi:two-component system response regulator YesN